MVHPRTKFGIPTLNNIEVCATATMRVGRHYGQTMRLLYASHSPFEIINKRFETER